MGVEAISNSEIKTFRSCRAKHHMAYTLRMRPAQTAPELEFGTAWHHLLEADLLGQERPALALEPYALARVTAMHAAYQERWPDGWEILAVEKEFLFPIENPDTGRRSQNYQLAGKIDAIVRVNGVAWVVEHKTTSSDLDAGGRYWQRLRMDTQCSAYLLAARTMGYEPRGIIYNVARKPQIKPLKATPEADRKIKKDGSYYASVRLQDETPEEFGLRCASAISENVDSYLARRHVVRTDDEIRQYQWDLWQDVKALHESRLAGRHSRNPDACWQYERECEYYPVCCGVASIDDPTLYQIRSRKHEELSVAG